MEENRDCFSGKTTEESLPPIKYTEKADNPDKGFLSPETSHPLETARKATGINHGEYDVKTGRVSWAPTKTAIPGLLNRKDGIPFQEHLLRNYSSSVSQLLKKALKQTIHNNECTEISVCAAPSREGLARHRYTFIPVSHKDATVTKVLFVIRNTVEAKSAFHHNRDTRKNSHLIAEGTRDVLFRIKLPEATCEYVSQAVQNITGYSPEIWYKNAFFLQKIIHPAWRVKFDREFRKLLRGNGQEDNSFPILHKEGDVRWVYYRTTTFRSKGGEIIAIEGIASDVTKRKQEEMERKQLIRKLKKTLTEVKPLSGLLPICSYCKKVRDDEGYWKQIESYITEHSELFFTHGLCPDCLSRHYPDYSRSKSTKKHT